MGVPKEFWVPWSDIDPEAQHGGIIGELGEFVGPRLGDNTETQNMDIATAFSHVRDFAASISMAPTANKEGFPGAALMVQIFKGVNWVLERIIDRTRTNTTPYFEWVHATPPFTKFAVRPIRFPLRCRAAHDTVFMLLGTLVEIAEMNVNAAHACIDPASCYRMLAPIYHMKANHIRDFFDQEVKGEITLDELQVLFGDIQQPGPVIVPPSESAIAPADEAIAAALAGVDLLQWYPKRKHWTIFGKKQVETFKPENIYQPEGSSTTTEDVASPNPITIPPIVVG